MELETFRLYNWEKPVFQRTELRDAYELLEKGAATQEQLNEAFKTLLKSNIDSAQGIAFDLFFYWETLGRWGIDNPYRTFSTMLAGAARRQLRRPPVKSGHVIGANHASALGVLVNLGSAEDIALIEPILRTSRDDSVIETALFALNNCLVAGEEFSQRLIETLAQIIANEDIDPRTREDAIGVFRNVKILPLAIERICLWIAQYASPQQSRLPMHAAWTLACTNLPRHRAFLTQLVAGWPQDTAYPASEVRDLLEEEDEHERDRLK